MLDALGALGQVVWIGQGAIGEKDGRVALYRRDRVATLFDPEAEGSAPGPVQQAILRHLENRGASFFNEITQALRGESGDEIFGALWDLVWSGRVTNDTFAPLRALGIKAAPHRRRGRRAGRPQR